MELNKDVKVASVSNPPHHKPPARSIEEDCDTDSSNILSLVNKLSFQIDEESKTEFFKELEDAIADPENGDEMNYEGLINFFIKHTSTDGKISA